VGQKGGAGGDLDDRGVPALFCGLTDVEPEAIEDCRTTEHVRLDRVVLGRVGCAALRGRGYAQRREPRRQFAGRDDGGELEEPLITDGDGLAVEDVRSGEREGLRQAGCD
jgi:hypothetical protein